MLLEIDQKVRQACALPTDAIASGEYTEDTAEEGDTLYDEE